MEEKIKVLTLSDHPMSPSGVGTQTKYFIEALIKTNKFKFICVGGAVKHQDYQPQRVEPYPDDWVVLPVDGYGNPELLRSLIRNEKPDIVWFMTDPRFYEWLWFIENEIRPIIPMVYYHVWDNFPPPKFNRPFYVSNDVIACISKVTHEIVKEVAPEVESVYIPHAVDSEVFVPYDEEKISEIKKNAFGDDTDRVTFFWNNRNARRKQSGSLVFWFNEFANEVGRDKVRLVMHTDPSDQHGQPLQYLLEDLGANDGTIMISNQKVPPDVLANMYNMSDCTINISDAEGFGLATLESLSCATPIIVNMTGGLQEQVTDGENYFGVGIEPSSKTVIGSQQVPYIYEDRISKEDFKDALHKIYNLSPEERKNLGLMGREHVLKNYNFEDYCKRWVDLMLDIYNNKGSWENRKGYANWNLKEVI